VKARTHCACRRANLRSMLAIAALASLCACGGGDPETAPTEIARKEALAASTNGSIVHRVTTRDKFAYAAYSESFGCEGFAVELFATKQRIKDDGPPTSWALLFAQLWSVNYCTGDSSFMSGQTEEGAMKFRNNLGNVTVAGTVVIQDNFGTTKTVSVDLDWNGGVLTADKNKTVTVTPVSRTIVKTVGKFSQSETITGSLMLDGVELLAANRPGSLGIYGFVAASAGTTIEITRASP
jgi:hypothetical protein